MKNLLLNSASRAVYNTEPVIINTGGAPADETGALIEQVVEARVEAALATETAEEAAEVAEAAEQRSEGLEEWQRIQGQQLSELMDRVSMLPTREEHQAMAERVAELQSSMLLLTPLLPLDPPLEPSSLTEETETLTEAAALAIAENPEIGAIALGLNGETNTSETPAEPLSEIETGALAENEGESLVVVAVAAEAPQGRRLRARLV